MPLCPPIPGLDLPDVLTSDQLLEGTDALYDSIVIMGGGVIGVEFATFYNNLGCQVTLVEGASRLLPTMDKELGQNLGQLLKKRGVEVLTSAMVQRVEQGENGLVVTVEQKGKEKQVAGQVVLCAIGRVPAWEGLFAPELTPEQVGKRLKVDETYQTSIPTVYAIGDLREPAVRGGRPDRPERGAQLHLQQSGDRRGGADRGGGQGTGRRRSDRQMHHVPQRPHYD